MEILVFSTLGLAAIAAHAGGPGFGFGFLFILIPLFFIGMFILFAVLGRRRWAHHGHGYGNWGSPSRSAESTLAERFAQGDIDEKEYRARLEVLRANNSITPPTK
jgi:putative membrane protein